VFTLDAALPVADQATRREHLVDAFTAADILMVSVLRILRHTDLLERDPVLVAYKQRCEARPAFRKALADQMATFAPAA
jgi:glutathione S-transferase